MTLEIFGWIMMGSATLVNLIAATRFFRFSEKLKKMHEQSGVMIQQLKQCEARLKQKAEAINVDWERI